MKHQQGVSIHDSLFKYFIFNKTRLQLGCMYTITFRFTGNSDLKVDINGEPMGTVRKFLTTSFERTGEFEAQD